MFIREFLFVTFILLARSNFANTSVTFYDTTLTFNTSFYCYKVKNVHCNDKEISNYVSQLDKCDFTILVTELKLYQENLVLDDWFLYKLIQAVSQKLTESQESNEARCLTWYILNKIGFDARICFYKNRIQCYISTQDSLQVRNGFHIDGNFYNLLSYSEQDQYFEQGEYSSVIINQKGNYFTFNIINLPKINFPKIENKEVKFEFEGSEISLNFQINQSIISLFEDYRSVNLTYAFHIPLSPEAHVSLIENIKTYIISMDTLTGIRFLLSFVRNGFDYMDDNAFYQEEKWMTPETVLNNNYSDCDDRVVLFHYLVKEIYNIPSVILQYDDHLSIALKITNPDLMGCSTPIKFDGSFYWICDPTFKDRYIGEMPDKYCGAKCKVFTVDN